MSVFAYLTNEDFDSSARVRDLLKKDALRAQYQPLPNSRQESILGIPLAWQPAGSVRVAPDDYDPVLRSHCRLGPAVPLGFPPARPTQDQ